MVRGVGPGAALPSLPRVERMVQAPERSFAARLGKQLEQTAELVQKAESQAADMSTGNAGTSPRALPDVASAATTTKLCSARRMGPPRGRSMTRFVGRQRVCDDGT